MVLCASICPRSASAPGSVDIPRLDSPRPCAQPRRRSPSPFSVLRTFETNCRHTSERSICGATPTTFQESGCVPAIVSEEVFELAARRLEDNRRFSRGEQSRSLCCMDRLRANAAVMPSFALRKQSPDRGSWVYYRLLATTTNADTYGSDRIDLSVRTITRLSKIYRQKRLGGLLSK